MDFNLYETENTDQLKAIVSRFNFRDTTIELLLDNNIKNTPSFSAFHKVMTNQIQIKGDFKQSNRLTGTWVHVYEVINDKQMEITDIDLRDSLLYFEQLVRNKIVTHEE